MTNVLFDFSNLLLPHGEDGVSYEYNKGNLTVNIPYDEKTKNIKLVFESSSYQYIGPVPGFCPDQIAPDFKFSSSRIYELSETGLLLEIEALYQNSNYKPNRRHFFFYLEWENVVFHIVAKSFEVNETNLV